MLTLFTMPKAFDGQVGMIQENAIRSWLALRTPGLEIILFGNEDGAVETARRLGVRSIPEVARNEYGTPLVNDLFAGAQRAAAHELLCYVNADIVLLDDFAGAVLRAAGWRGPFLMVGRRWNLDLTAPLEFGPGWESGLRTLVARRGRLFNQFGIDYFVFPRGLFSSIPAFAIGRTHWDNWLVRSARTRLIPVIDATAAVTAVHQNHDYRHVFGGALAGDGSAAAMKMETPEGRRNLELAGGPGYVFSLDDATHVLDRGRLRPVPVWRRLRRQARRLAILHPALLRPMRLFRRVRARFLPSRGTS